LPVHLSPIRTQAADTAQQQRSASPYGNGARMNGASSPSHMLSPVKTGTSSSGVGGSIGSPRTVPSPAPAAVTSFIDSILSAPTANTPTREGRSSAGGGVEGRWGSDWGAGSSSGAGSMTPAAAVAAALAGVSTPPQSGSPRHSATGGGAGSSRASQAGAFSAAAAAPSTPTRLSVASGSGSNHTPLSVQQGALAAQLAAAAAAAAQAAMAGSPRAVQGSSSANWRSVSTSAAGASISAPTTPLAGLSAGDAVAEALESLGLGNGSSSSRAIPVGSPDLSSSPKPAPWVPASRLQHMQQAAAHGEGRHSMRSSGSEAEDNTAGSWRSSWTGQAGSPLGGSHMRPPKHRTSGSGGASHSGGKQRRRSWHATEAEADAAARSRSSGGVAAEGNSSDGSPGMAAGSSSSGRRTSRLAQQGGDLKSSICAIREASGELEALVAAAEANSGRGVQQRRRSSQTGDGAGAACSSRDAGEEQDDEHEDGEHEHGKRRRRRHRGSGSRRTSLDEPHPSAGGGGSRRQSLDEGGRGGSRRQSLDEPGPRHSSRPGSRAGALSPAPEEGSHAAHSRPHSSCSGGGGKPHSHQGSPSPASHMSGEHRSSHDGSVVKEGSKKKEKKDYASWAAATPEFRAAAAGAKRSAGGAANSSGSSPARAGLSPLRASGGGAASGHDGDSHVRIARMPDGTRGFGMGRGRPLTPAP
jgi:hypothetical protein